MSQVRKLLAADAFVPGAVKTKIEDAASAGSDEVTKTRSCPRGAPGRLRLRPPETHARCTLAFRAEVRLPRPAHP